MKRYLIIGLLLGVFLALGGTCAASITFVAATENDADSTSITVTVPTGVQDGDLLIMVCTQAEDEDGNWNTPSGWTQEVVDHPVGGTPPSVPGTSVFSRIAASEPASYACTITNTATDLVAKMVAFRSVDTGTPMDATPTTANGGNSANPDPPSITTVTDGAFVFAIAFQDNSTASSLTIPTGYTDPDGLGLIKRNTSGSNGCSLAVAYKEIVTAGAEDPGTFGFTASEEWGAISVAIRPTVVGGGKRRFGVIGD